MTSTTTKVRLRPTPIANARSNAPGAWSCAWAMVVGSVLQGQFVRSEVPDPEGARQRPEEDLPVAPAPGVCDPGDGLGDGIGALPPRDGDLQPDPRLEVREVIRWSVRCRTVAVLFLRPELLVAETPAIAHRHAAEPRHLLQCAGDH